MRSMIGNHSIQRIIDAVPPKEINTVLVSYPAIASISPEDNINGNESEMCSIWYNASEYFRIAVENKHNSRHKSKNDKLTLESVGHRDKKSKKESKSKEDKSKKESKSKEDKLKEEDKLKKESKSKKENKSKEDKSKEENISKEDKLKKENIGDEIPEKSEDDSEI